MAKSTKEAYRMEIEEKIKKYEDKMEQLRNEALDKTVEGRQELDALMDNARTNLGNARDKLRQLRNSTEKTWDDVREGLEKSWEIARDTTEKASARFKQVLQEQQQGPDNARTGT
ncbi:MAG: hypothetical protein GF398_04190 [Chitinivibrionales bacterium]|nr:hypothetical protein [Chitinivibrionales bacterium]